MIRLNIPHPFWTGGQRSSSSCIQYYITLYFPILVLKFGFLCSFIAWISTRTPHWTFLDLHLETRDMHSFRQYTSPSIPVIECATSCGQTEINALFFFLCFFFADAAGFVLKSLRLDAVLLFCPLSFAPSLSGSISEKENRHETTGTGISRDFPEILPIIQCLRSNERRECVRCETRVSQWRWTASPTQTHHPNPPEKLHLKYTLENLFKTFRGVTEREL